MSRRITVFSLLALAVMAAYVLLVAIPVEAVKPAHKPLVSSPSDVGLQFETFSTSPADSDLQLAGWWMPAPSPRAVLVFIHGGGSHRNSRYFESLEFYRAMVDQEVSVAAIDLRNHGESGSDGNGLQFGRTEKHDALAAVDWARRKAPGLPLYLMGISMGGSTSIHAAHAGADIDGLILLDPLLDTRDTFIQGAVVQSALPAALFVPAAWSATQFFGLPSGDQEALALASELDLPILLIQDPDDPVTRAVYARELARRNPGVKLWLAPPIDPAHPELAWKEGWGSHVSAFIFYPGETVTRITRFMDTQAAR